jgi:MFS family permease
MKPYNYSDFQIALFAVILILMGVIGAIIWSLYLKKTTNYKFTIRAIPSISVIVMIGICIALNAGAPTAVVFILGGAVGFSVTPIMPISYDLGCELSFPVG